MKLWIRKPNLKEYESTLDKVKYDVDHGLLDAEICYCWYEGIDNWVKVAMVLPPNTKNELGSKEIPQPDSRTTYSSLEKPKTIKSTVITDVMEPQNKNVEKKGFRITIHFLANICIILTYIIVSSVCSNYTPDRKNGGDALWIIVGSIILYRRSLRKICERFIANHKSNRFLKVFFFSEFIALLKWYPIYLVILFSILDSNSLSVGSITAVLLTIIIGFICSIDIPWRVFFQQNLPVDQRIKDNDKGWVCFYAIIVVMLLSIFFVPLISALRKI
jgi:hypothetical protein